MKLKTTTLKRGLLLYHGASSPDFDERAGELLFPSWFSEKERVARRFVHWRGKPEPSPRSEKLPDSARIITYRVAEPIKVLLIPDSETLDFIRDEFGVETGGVETLSEWVLTNGYDGWVIPNNYPDESGSDIMLGNGEGLEYVETKDLNEDQGDAEDMADEFKEVSGSDPLLVVYTLIEQAGVTDIMAKNSERTTTFTGKLHSGAYPRFTKDGTKIEVADLCYAQQLAHRIENVKGVERAQASTQAEGYASAWRHIHLWVLWADLKEMNQQASKIVNILVEANSAHLELATRAARWLYQNDPDFFEGGCAAVNQVIKRFLESQQVPVRLLLGYAVFRRQREPHAWLEIEGQQFDPVYALQGISPKSYEPAGMALGDFGVDEENAYHDALVQQLQQAVVRA